MRDAFGPESPRAQSVSFLRAPGRTAGPAAFLLAGLLATAAAPARLGADSALEAHLREHGRAPVEYIVSKADSHQVTLIGEAHWLAHDVALVAELVPHLRKAQIDLAVEFLPAAQQASIDALLAAPSWNEHEANAILRAASWPYRDYRDLLRSVWEANRGSEQPMTIVALAPPSDWRSVLVPRGITYDSFMADRVVQHVGQSRRRLLVYCGMHHAFTRYYQTELDDRGVATGYMDRMGNLLWRRFGQEVFLIALHKPVWCGDPAVPKYCLPFGGRLDCEAAALGRPLAFDVAGSPFAELRFAPDDYYARGYAALRFVDYTDGYVWTGPIEAMRPVSVLPLAEYAPDATAMTEVARRNPFTDEDGVSHERLAEIWARQTAERADLLASRKWDHLADWRSRCAKHGP